LVDVIDAQSGGLYTYFVMRELPYLEDSDNMTFVGLVCVNSVFELPCHLGWRS
jgi:hypothetical protein